jgi:hypothetical protein
MNPIQNACYEIVFCKFTSSISPVRQNDALSIIGQWLKVQPGFLNRKSFYDAEQNAWVDLVSWSDSKHAKEAMLRSQSDESLGQVFSLMELSSINVGHYALSTLST